MKIGSPHFSTHILAATGALLAAALLVSCGSTTTTQAPAVTGVVRTTISDPPACSAVYDHVYVTVTKVTAHISSTADESASGWQTLADLTAAPKQIDLLHLPGAGTCILSQSLGQANGLPVGKYQQIRLYLLANNAASGPADNQCGASAFNCVVPMNGTAQTLLLPSEAQTGLKVPPGQIAGGGLDLEAGQAADINIDFDACSSILRQGNSAYRLKPTLRAGVVSATTNLISGHVVDSSNSNAGVGGAPVLLEQPDPNDSTVLRVVRSTTTASDGAFTFCPLESDGTFNLVASAWLVPSVGQDVTFHSTAIFGVPVGTNLSGTNAVSLVPVGAAPILPATITGQVTSAGSGGALAADVTLSAMQQVTPSGGSATWLTIPVFGALTHPPTFTTTDTPNPANPPCPAGTLCYNYSLPLPSGNPQVGVFSSGSIAYTAPAGDPVNYDLEGLAPDCTTSVPSPARISGLTVTPGNTTDAGTVLVFSGCQ
ncbi:MAG: DUF4382 domain-containing protein [Acidobacteria bacterium]|nr:DUF4382 domain-containing protein [Acidobacteriota bacterium]